MSESSSTQEQNHPTLSPEDALAVDALLNKAAGGESAAGNEGVSAERLARADAWLKVLDRSPRPEPRGDLAQRTLEAVQQDRMVLQPAADRADRASTRHVRGRWTRRLAEVGAMGIAAALLIAVALQGLGQAKKSSARVACQTNLKNIGMAFNSYSIVTFSNELPCLAMPANRSWLHGDAETGAHNNAANLLPLITGKFIRVSDLFCAGAGIPTGPITFSGTELPEIGYSYRNLYGAARPTWDGLASTIILADRNPLLATPGAGPAVANANSRNHDGHGTYVLHADASASWETSPNIGPDNDNIWTIGKGTDRRTTYSGTEVPDSVADVFLCP